MLKQRPEVKFQTLTVLSTEALASRSLSGEIANRRISSVCPANVRENLLVLERFDTLIRSYSIRAIWLFNKGFMSTEHQQELVFICQIRDQSKLDMFQTFILLSGEALVRYLTPFSSLTNVKEATILV